MPWRSVEDVLNEVPPSESEIREVIDYLGRRATPRFYADENFPARAIELLRRRGGKVRTAREARLVGRADEDHLAYARRHEMILVTCDRDFLNERRFPLVHCPAIFVFDFGSGTLAEITQAYRCLAAAFQTPQFFDKWCKVDAKRDSWSEYARYQNGSTSRTRFRVFGGKLQEWVA